MFKKILMILTLISLFSCGKEGKDRDNSKSNPALPQQSQPPQQQPTQQPLPPPKADDVNLKVYFLPFSSDLLPIEKERLVATYTGLNESKGYWIIIGHSFDRYFSLHRARVVESFLRHEMKYDVVGIIEGKDYGDWGFVDVTFSHY